MDIKSLLGGVSIGQDTSGNFKLSFNGLAVKTPDDRFVAYVKEKEHANDHLLDVTDLTIDGTDNLVFRVPVKTVKRGDLIITSDTPFIAYFVLSDGDANGKISVLDPQNSTSTEYTQAANLFRIRFFVKVFTPIPVDRLGLGTLGEGDLDDKILPLLLLSDKTDDSLTKLLLLQTLGGKSLGGNVFESNALLLLSLLKGGQSDMLQTLLLTQAFEEEGEEKEGLSLPEGHTRERRSTRPRDVE